MSGWHDRMWAARRWAWLVLLLPLPGWAGEVADVKPDLELLEFIGSWEGTVEDSHWLRSLDLGFWLAGEGREEADEKDSD